MRSLLWFNASNSLAMHQWYCVGFASNVALKILDVYFMSESNCWSDTPETQISFKKSGSYFSEHQECIYLYIYCKPATRGSSKSSKGGIDCCGVNARLIWFNVQNIYANSAALYKKKCKMVNAKRKQTPFERIIRW